MANVYGPGNSMALAHALNPAAEDIENGDGEGADVFDTRSKHDAICGPIPPLDEELILLSEGDDPYEIVKEKFLRGLCSLREQTSDVSIYRISYSGVTREARVDAFRRLETATANKNGGNANVKYAWYGTTRGDGSKIVKHGCFSSRMIEHNGTLGCGVYLSPDNCLDCLRNLSVDIYGSRHLLVCRVILGKVQVVHPGRKQCHPSSQEFDSGTDKLIFPDKYIVWGSNVSTHILPEYVVSFRAPRCLKAFSKQVSEIQSARPGGADEMNNVENQKVRARHFRSASS